MFALDLFNNDHERRLTEGAVDTLEQRRIDDLAMKMDGLVARARTATTPEAKAALVREFQKCKDERDSYYKIRNETMGYGSLVGEEGIPGNVPAEKIPGKEDLLKGKGRSYYEGEVTRTATGVKHRSTNAYGGTPKEKDPLATLDKAGTNRAEKAMGIKFDREKKYQGGLDLEVDEAGIPGNVPAEKIPGKEDLLKGKGRSYYESQKKNSEEVNEGQRLHVGDPVIVTAPNEFEGKTGEISEFSPSGKFVVVNLYNHGEHSMHLSDVEYNQYADTQEDEDDWYDDGAEDTLESRQELTPYEAGEADGLSNEPYENPYPEGSIDYTEFRKGYRTGQADKDLDEGYQDFNKVEPYYVCIGGKPWKKFDYYEDARRAHDNLKKKWYKEGNPKYDTVTLMPVMDEAMSKKDLLGKLAKDLNTPFKKAKAGKLKSTGKDFTKGDHWTGPDKDDPSYTRNFGHGYPDTPSNRSHDRYVNKSLKKDVDEADETSWTANSAKFRKEEDLSWPVEITLEPKDDINRGRGAQVKTMTVTGQSRDAAKKKLVDYYRKNGWAVTGIKFTGDLDEGSFAHDQLKGEINDLFKPVVLQIVKWARAEGMTAKDLAGTSSHFFLDALDPDTYDRTQHLPDNYFNKLMDKANAKAVEILKKKGVAEESRKQELDRKFNSPEQLKKDADYRAYRAGVKASRKQPPAPIKEFAPSPDRDDNDEVPDQILTLANRWWNATDDQPKITNVLRSLGWSISQVESEDDAVQMQHDDGTTYFISADDFDPDVFEAETDYSKRRQREKDIDAGKPVARQRQPRMTDYQKRRAQQKKEMELGEGDISQLEKALAAAPVKPIANMESAYEDQDTSGVEQAILHRIMVAHTDLLKQFGPQKVMQAAEEVAYNVGDVDEIGTSDVSAYVAQVKQILGAV